MPWSKEENLLRNNEFSLYDLSWVIITTYLVCLIYAGGVEKKIVKEILQFHFMTYMATLLHKNTCPGGHKIYNCGRPFCLIYAWEK